MYGSEENGMDEMIRKTGRILTPLLIHLGISLGTALLLSAVLRTMGNPKAAEDAALQTSFGALCSIPALIWIWRKDREQCPSAAAGKCSGRWIYAAAFLCGVLASLLGGLLMERSGIKTCFSNQVQEELFAGNAAVQLVGLGVIVPVAEELLYRGVVYERLREGLPQIPAVVIAASLFAFCHGNVIQMIYALPMALLLHLFYELSGSLLAPIVFHMGANLISICLEMSDKL